MELKDRIRELRIKRGLSQEELGTLVGLQKAAIHKYESGIVVNPKRSLIEKLAEVLDTTPTYLMGWDNNNNHEKFNLEIYPVGELTKIPVIGTVRAGNGGIAYEQPLGFEYVEVEDVAGGDYFFLRVEGDSMAPKIEPGDLVLVRKQDDIESGEIAVVIMNGEEGCVKKVKKLDNGYLLISFNDKHEPLEIVGKDLKNFHIAGKVKQSRKKF